MNTKTKKISWQSVAFALVLILLASTIVGIVAYAAGSKSHTIGGNVTFSAEGVEATVEATGWEGCTIGGESYSDGQTTLKSITYSTDSSTKNSSTEAIATWTGMSVVITNTDGVGELAAGVATLTFKVTNNFTDGSSISVSIANAIFGTGDDASETNDSISISTSPTSATIAEGESETFTITFTVASPSYDMSEIAFSVPVTLEQIEMCTISFTDVDVSGWQGTVAITASYCINDGSWTNFTSSGETITISVISGSTISFRGYSSYYVSSASKTYYDCLHVSDSNNAVSGGDSYGYGYTYYEGIYNSIVVTVTSSSTISVTSATVHAIW